MLILVAYDVSTEAKEGRRRLRRVARVCQDYGQRVQKSVFECKVNTVTYAMMEQRLLEEIDVTEDDLRFYRLNEPLGEHVREFGRFKAVDFEGPLMV